MQMIRPILPALAPLLAGAFLSSAALAHHPIMVPDTPLAGVISGLAHPVIGLDHLAFLLAAALAMAARPNFAWLPWYFILPGLMAAAWHVAGFQLAGIEIWVALSLVVLGVLLIRRRLGPMLLQFLLMLAGVLHGYAFGESVVGSETTPMLGYFAGLAVAQYAICLGAILLYRKAAKYWFPGQDEQALWRPAGWAAAVAGVVFLVLAVIA